MYTEAMLNGGHINANMQDFMEKDRHVMRFFAIVDDLQTPQFERRPFILLYFLADKTVSSYLRLVISNVVSEFCF
jgi:hypothetical protein